MEQEKGDFRKLKIKIKLKELNYWMLRDMNTKGRISLYFRVK